MKWSRSFLRRLNVVMRAVLTLCPAAGRRNAPAPLSGAPRRVLLVKLVGMGDAVLVRSLAEHLRHRRPDIEIGMLAGPATREVLTGSSRFIAHVYDPAGADQGLGKLLAKIGEIRGRSYDAVIDFEQHIVLVALLLRLARVPCRVGLSAADNPRRRFQTHTVPLTGADSMWHAYTALMSLLEPSLDGVSAVPLPRGAAVPHAIARWWQAHDLCGSRVVALHLGCGSRAVARRWPLERFVQVAEALVAAGQADAILLTGTEGEQSLVRTFTTLFSGHAVNATGLGSIERTAEALGCCRLVVSNDTGVMHLAAAMGTPTVGLFGPNSPQRYAPVGLYTASVYTTRAPCSPCIHIHEGIVPECCNPIKGRCLLDIEVADVLARAVELLARAGKGQRRSPLSDGDAEPERRVAS